MRRTVYAATFLEDVVLDPETCLMLLSTCDAGSLACTVRAMPTVVPVGVSVHSGRVCVALNDAVSAKLFAGQVVALGAGVAPTPRANGWWVIARGELQRVSGSERQLVLETCELDGRALPGNAQ
jgi:hypothetical protein